LDPNLKSLVPLVEGCGKTIHEITRNVTKLFLFVRVISWIVSSETQKDATAFYDEAAYPAITSAKIQNSFLLAHSIEP